MSDTVTQLLIDYGKRINELTNKYPVTNDYFIGALKAQNSAKKEIDELILLEQKDSRLNELKHRTNDAIERMWRVDRDFTSNFVKELQEYYVLKDNSNMENK